MKTYVKQVLPQSAIEYLKTLQQAYIKAKRGRLCPLGEDTFRNILMNDLGIAPGDVVFIHSSLRSLGVSFPFSQLWQIIWDAVGPDGTLLFPTYPRLSSYAYLTSGEVFDVRNTPSYTGFLTEFARRQPTAIRSLHPTKSVCALGPLAKELTNTHHKSPYPYDTCSPYYKMIDTKSAKIIGLGVSTNTLPFCHCVGDVLKERFIVQPYHNQLFEANCINYEGEVEIVKTYAHNVSITDRRNTPRYMHKYISRYICRDMKIFGRAFFVVRSPQHLLQEMIRLAQDGITIYPKRLHKKGSIRNTWKTASEK